MEKMSLLTKLGSICLVVMLMSLFLITFENPAEAAPTVLRFSTHLPKADPLIISMEDGLRRVEEKTKGMYKFETYYDGTLIAVKDSWEELIRGTADIVNISAHNSPAEKLMPLFMMLGNAWVGVKDMPTQLRIQQRLLSEFPELAAEWAPVKPLSLQGILDFQIHTKKAVRTLADLKGMQLRGLGAWPKYTVEKLGGSLIAMPVGEVYIALQKGIINGLIHDNSSLQTYRLAEVAKYTTLLGGVYPGVNNRMCFNLNSWKKLSPDTQKIFEETEEYINRRYIEIRLERLHEAENFAKEKEHEFISLSPADLGRIHELMREEGRKSAEALDVKGLPGTKIFDRLQKLIAESK